MVESFISGADLELWAAEALAWIDQNVLNWWNLAQVVGLALIWLATLALDRLVRPPLMQGLARARIPARARPLLGRFLGALRALLFLVLLWLVVAVMREVTWPSRSYLLGVAASLVSAWLLISIASKVIRNRALSVTVAAVAWGIAALNIVGLLSSAVAALDSVGLDLGGTHISLLTFTKGAIALFLLLWLALAVSRLLEQRLQRASDLTPTMRVLLGKVVRILFVTVAFLAALDTVGIDLTALAVFSGAIGLGLGFGLQKVVSNLVSGIILLLDKSIKPGDVIELGQTFGWITALGARYASVVTRDGREYLIPNEDLITQQVVNWSYSSQLVRLEVALGVGYECDPHQVRRLAREAAVAPRRVLDDPAPVCHLAGFGESSLDFVLRFWIRDPNQGVVNVKGEVLLAVWDAFKAHGITIPYPHRELIVQSPVKVESLAMAAE